MTFTPAFLQRSAAFTDGITCIQTRSVFLTASDQGTGSPAEVTRTLNRLFISGSSSRIFIIVLMISPAISFISADTMTLTPKMPWDSLVFSRVRLKIALKIVSLSASGSASPVVQKYLYISGWLSLEAIPLVLRRPRTPALADATHRLLFGKGPIPAWMMGYFIPTRSQSLDLIINNSLFLF